MALNESSSATIWNSPHTSSTNGSFPWFYYPMWQPIWRDSLTFDINLIKVEKITYLRCFFPPPHTFDSLRTDRYEHRESFHYAIMSHPVLSNYFINECENPFSPTRDLCIRPFIIYSQQTSWKNENSMN